MGMNELKKTSRKTDNTDKKIRRIFVIAAAVIVVAAICGFFIIRGVRLSLNKTVYTERTNQLSEITSQIFSSTDWKISQYWHETVEVKRRISDYKPRTSAELTEFLGAENNLGHYKEDEVTPIAIDEDGRMYSPTGDNGIIGDTNPLVNCTERVSFIKYNTLNVENDIVFVYKLEQPIKLSDTEREICFVGINVGMETIGSIFRSSAYDGNNSTYILSADGAKLYVDETKYKNLVPGYNVFNVLKNACEQENVDFDEQLNTLETEGGVLSHVTIEGVECFYAIRKMQDNDWNVMYINPAQEVAQGTVAVVNSATRTAVITAVFFLAASIVVILFMTKALHTRGLLKAEYISSQKLQELNKQLEQAKQEAEEAYFVSQRANHAKTAFLNNMSHDIRTPMNAIIGFTSLAATHLDDTESVKNYLQKIMVSSEHLLSLINDVLDMSRIESGKVKIEEKECSLPAILHDLRNILQSDIKAKRLNFYIDTVDVEHEDIFCDKLRLNQILINIMSNAMKFTHPGGTVALRVVEKPNAPDGYADYQFIVRDTGIGMSEEFVGKIFEPFTREENSTVSGIQGTGLGMAITKNIVDMMNGTIDVKSKLGEGSEFTVSVRFAVSGNQQKITVIKELEGFRSLIADDNMDSCTSVEKMLRMIGLRPEWTTSGKEAVYRAKYAFEQNDPFQVYIIDWLMPDMNGIEVVRRIRQEIGDTATIIILTAYDWTDIETEAKAAGVTAFCAKPLFASELYSILQTANSGGADTQKQEIIPEEFAGKKVLLVDDVELNREIAVAILEEAGFIVETAVNGKQAVDIVKACAGDIDLVLMDVMMPIMDGYQATREIRALPDPVLANIPIVAMTANAFEEDKQAALDAGMNDHLAKPFQIEKLYQVMKKYL